MSSATDEIKTMVKEKYTQIANQSKDQNSSSCCGAGGCSSEDIMIFSEDYSQIEGYQADSDLGLGCGIPTLFANIQKGSTVLDLGSGAGNDAFVARSLTGETGKVIGVDFTEAMIEKARDNADRLGFSNVEFRPGDIEKLPVGPNRVDVVISNCVLNLVPDKKKAFSEIMRVLKPGGSFCVSDIVLEGNLPKDLQKSAEMYAGCVTGAIQKSEYLSIVKETGFLEIQIKKEKEIVLPDDILLDFMNKDGIEEFRKGGAKILSITVVAHKEFCAPEKGCC